MFKLLLSLFTYLPHRRFILGIRNIESAQNDVLKKILMESRKLSYYLEPVSTYEKFKELPINEYQTFAKNVLLDIDGGENNSVCGKVVSTEKTSGTISGSKIIPYTKRHLFNFLNLTSIWVFDLIHSKKINLTSFKTFISISPAFSESTSDLKNQLESDEEYLPLVMRLLFGHKLLFPKEIKGIRDPDLYNKRLAIHLLSIRELEIISIWNPTYLLTYLNFMIEHYEDLKKLVPRNDLPLKLNQENIHLIWPKLKLISCWGDSNSKNDFFKLKNLFPNISFQKKGLLSTEFPMTLPLVRNEIGHYPFLTGIFIELQNEEGIFRLHEIELGKEYTLILSAPGGFHRYNTHDLVKVVGFDGQCPLFEFVGRDNCTSDMVGEKLAEVFVKKCIESICSNSFTYLRAISTEERKYYELVTNNRDFDTDRLEELLRENVHYNYARNIKQLDALKTQYSLSAENEFYQAQVSSGKKLGNIKRQYLLVSSNV